MRHPQHARLAIIVVFGLLLSSAWARGEQHEAPADGQPKPRHISPAEARSRSLLTHHRNEKRAKPYARKPKHEKRQDVAVMVDQGTVVTRARPENLMDLVRALSIEFTPAGDGYAVSYSDEGPDVYGSVALAIDEPTDAEEVSLEFPFPFFGESYTTVWVNGAGNLTFRAPDTDPFDPVALRDLPRFAAGPPRIAPLYSDLFPATVAVETLSDRVVITWDTSGGGAGVQAVLRVDGSIRFSYSNALGVVSNRVGDSVIGLSPGESGAAVQVLDYLSDLPTTVGRGVIAEAFGASQNLFDLSLQSLTFAPVEGGFAMSRGPASFDSELGPALEIADGDEVDLTLPFLFPLLNQEYDQVVVLDDGAIGLGAECTRASRAFMASPCIWVFGRNLQPHLGGSIHAAVRGDRLVVTWSDVPSFGITVNAQTTLYSDGRVVLSYPRPMIAARNVIVGVIGGLWRRPIVELDFSADLPAMVTAGTVVEHFTSFFQHFDLLDRNLTFTPDSEGFRIATGRGGFDDAHHRLSDRIPVGCDFRTTGCGSAEVTLPFAFPFLGRSYERLFVNASGNVTFGAPDPDDVNAARMLGGPPRITPFGFRGDSSSIQLGRVSAFADSGLAVITWDSVLADAEITMQLMLAPDGAIRFVYSSLPLFGLVGIAEGSNEEPIHEVDLTADHPAPLAAGMIFEEFVYAIPFATVDTVELAREFYAQHPDKFDMLVVFTDFPVDLQGGFAFNASISNATLGLGFFKNIFGVETFDFSSFYGSGGELESLLMMNNINIYWPDAHRMIDPPIEGEGHARRRIMGIGDGGPAVRTTGPWTLGPDSPMSLLAHEVGHRWLAGPSFIHPQTGVGSDSLDLFNSDFHWSRFMHTALPAGQFQGDPRASALEGQIILDQGGRSFPFGSGIPDCNVGERAFQTDPLRLFDGYSALDQYLMGLRPAFEVGPFFYVDNARGVSSPPSPRGDPNPTPVRTGICGNRVDLAVSDLIAHPDMGPRIPALGDENDAGGIDVKTMAFVLLTMSDDHGDAVKRVDTFRKAWERYARGFATGMRGRFDTSLDPKIY